MQIELLVQKVQERFRLREQALKDSLLGAGEYPYGNEVAARLPLALQQLRDIVASFAPETLPPRLKALLWVLQLYTNEDYRVTYAYAAKSPGRIISRAELLAPSLDASKLQVSTYNAYDWKCNKLVADAYAVGAGVGLSVGQTLGGMALKGNGYPAAYEWSGNTCYLWAPQANVLAKLNHNLRSLTLAKNLRTPRDPQAQPELGDILAFPTEYGLGHSALYLGRRLIVSAKTDGIELETEEYETVMHEDKARIRKFTASGR